MKLFDSLGKYKNYESSPMSSEDIYGISVNDPRFSDEDRQYFASSEFQSMSGAAKISIFKQRLESRTNPKETRTSEELEEQKWLEHNRRAELFLQQHAESERRREEARQAEAKKPRRW